MDNCLTGSFRLRMALCETEESAVLMVEVRLLIVIIQFSVQCGGMAVVYVLRSKLVRFLTGKFRDHFLWGLQLCAHLTFSHAGLR